MNKRAFSPFERFAVFVTHNEKCYMCGHPLDLQTMEVDHVIPEALLETPDRLAEVLCALGRRTGFDVNSYENWLPACRACNGKKLAEVFDPSPLIQICLQRAYRNAEAAAKLAAEALTQRKISNALNVLQRADQSGQLNQNAKAQLKPLVAFQEAHRSKETAGTAVRLTPLYVVLSEGSDFQMVQGPYGDGRRAKAKDRHTSWDCSHCGAIAAWSGARCVICGYMDDD